MQRNNSNSALEPPSGPKVLVVEDEAALRFLTTEFLSSEGDFEVVAVGSGDEAIEFLRTHNVDCVFTDIRMPGRIDGLALAQFILDTRPNIKVIIASGNLLETVQLKGVPFFAKPYDCVTVAKTIRALLASPT